jgi:ribosomal protein L11 methyltransferase
VPWQQLTLRLAATELPETEALLRLAGAVSLAISDDADSPILEPAPGTTPLWPQLTVRALFVPEIDLTAIARVVDTGGTEPLIETIADEDWLESVKQTITPIRIGARLCIVPAEDFRGSVDTLALNMGLAFGTGRHPTTRLCLEWLERHPPTALDVLDYGAGTGVLALAALKLGAKQDVAIDSDPQALAAARRNAELNGFEDLLWVGSPENLPAHAFDLILANILAEPLIELAATLADRQKPGARIVLSGILAGQADSVEQRYAAYYADLIRHESDGWSLVTGTRRN